jgi:hypothetical protein
MHVGLRPEMASEGMCDALGMIRKIKAPRDLIGYPFASALDSSLQSHCPSPAVEKCTSQVS